MGVLILIVVDNGLVRIHIRYEAGIRRWSLNPYCSGQWSRTSWMNLSFESLICLNPYCSGQWSRTTREATPEEIRMRVLILIVVDNGLVLTNAMFDGFKRNVS